MRFYIQTYFVYGWISIGPFLRLADTQVPSIKAIRWRMEWTEEPRPSCSFWYDTSCLKILVWKLLLPRTSFRSPRLLAFLLYLWKIASLKNRRKLYALRRQILRGAFLAIDHGERAADLASRGPRCLRWLLELSRRWWRRRRSSALRRRRVKNRRYARMRAVLPLPPCGQKTRRPDNVSDGSRRRRRRRSAPRPFQDRRCRQFPGFSYNRR